MENQDVGPSDLQCHKPLYVIKSFCSESSPERYEIKISSPAGLAMSPEGSLVGIR